MNTRERQTVLLIGVMFILAVGSIFIFAGSSASGDSLFEGQTLPEPFNGLVNQSINGLRAISGDVGKGQDAINENKDAQPPDVN